MHSGSSKKASGRRYLLSDLGEILIGNFHADEGVKVRHGRNIQASGTEWMKSWRQRGWCICVGNECMVHENIRGREIRLRRWVGPGMEGLARLAMEFNFIKYTEAQNTFRKVYKTQVCINAELNKLSIIWCFSRLWLP